MTSGEIPEGLKAVENVVFGMRRPGLLEIKFHSPKRNNPINMEQLELITNLVNEAQEDAKVKVILLHGGKYFTSGLDVSVFAPNNGMTPEQAMAYYQNGSEVVMPNFIMAIASSIKPVIMVVRGGCIGIGMTMLTHASFVFTSPEAKMVAPFVQTFQTPEGTSTLQFPRVFGAKVANEILLTGRPVSAEDAVLAGFSNGVIDSFDPSSEWFEPESIPVLKKLLRADGVTL